MDRVRGLLSFILFFACCSSSASPVPKLPVLKFERRWLSQLSHIGPMQYGSASIQISNETLYVLNGAEAGNAILKFNLEGKYLGEFPGWYNWPIDMVLGGDPKNPQPLVSAIGAMNDTGTLRFGMVLYNESGNFFHGFHQPDTGIQRPYGMNLIPGTNQLAVCDWQGNRTVFMDVGWSEGKMSASSDPVIAVPYPGRVAVSSVKDLRTQAVEKKYIIASAVCCEPWHEKLRVVRIFDQTGKLLKTIKNLPNGEKIEYPQDVSVDPEGNIIIVEQSKTTRFFDSGGNYIGDIKELEAPNKIVFHKGKVYTVGMDEKDKKYYVNVFSYTN